MKILSALIFSLFITLSTFAFAIDTDKPLAKPFTATALNGQVVNLTELRGKVVVLTFWSTTCPICSSELPKLSAVADKYAGKDVIFLAAAMENETRLSNYLKKKPFNSIILPNSLGIVMDYASPNENGYYNVGFPTFFIINQAGEIEMQASGRNKTGAIDKQINQLLMNN